MVFGPRLVRQYDSKGDMQHYNLRRPAHSAWPLCAASEIRMGPVRVGLAPLDPPLIV